MVPRETRKQLNGQAGKVCENLYELIPNIRSKADQITKIMIEGGLAADKLDSATTDLPSLGEQCFVLGSHKRVFVPCVRPGLRITMRALQITLVSQFQPEKVKLWSGGM